MKKLIIVAISALALAACTPPSQDAKDKAAANKQQSQYAKIQPVPAFNWSLERHLVIQLLNARNMRAATHSVWRSNTGVIEGDCASIGFGIPYDTSLTNPLTAVDFGKSSYDRQVVEQAEPNGIFISKNTSATWVLCAGDNGDMLPIYIESKVTVYPYPVTVDYQANRAIKSGDSSISITKQ